ncbi:MAG TPA: hypothetical protein VHZ78_08440 [Rhizomicrobium sp.]|jgi:hypothetical protein|nr:hypothetical protein [Rhizomicrobium sp.]
MFSPLLPITIDSIYKHAPLPPRLAKCTPDMYAAAFALKAELRTIHSDLVLSDMFRSYDMQHQANLDYVNKKKTAYSPPAGGSMHEAGRAIDLDLEFIKAMGLTKFWPIAAKHGFTPILDAPDITKNEAWHFDCRGSHQLVYDYYKAGKGDNFKSPYTAMAASGIVSLGQPVDALGKDVKSAYIQSGLIRLGQTIGDLDGSIGAKSRDGLTALGVDPKGAVDDIAAAIDALLQKAFPQEFAVPGAHIDSGDVPAHLAGVMGTS